MLLISNEYDIAKKIIDKKNVKLKHGKKMNILAKYYIHHEKKDKDEVKELLHDYNKKNVKGNYIWEKYESYVLNVIKSASKYPLINIKKLVVFEEEIQTIRQLNDPIKEKVLFSMLMNSKYTSAIKQTNSSWSNLDLIDIFDLANCKKRKNDRDIIVNTLANLGFIRNTHKHKSFDREVLFVKTSGKIAFEVCIFEDFGLQYEKFVLDNEKISNCTECGRFIEIKNGRPNQYCKECAREKQLEIDRKYQENKRKSSKSQLT